MAAPAWRFRVLRGFCDSLTASRRLVGMRRGRGCFIFRFRADSGRRARAQDDLDLLAAGQSRNSMMGGELRVQAHVLQMRFHVGGGQGPEHARRGLGHLHVDLLAGLVPACAERSCERRLHETRSWLVASSISSRFEAFRGPEARSRLARRVGLSRDRIDGVDASRCRYRRDPHHQGQGQLQR